jgi:uncharacterized cofD-like protein
MTSRPKVVVIGGGTGSFAILSGLKYLDCELTALVNMADNGGSTGQLRDEYGVLPPGDVRQCLIALSDSAMPLRQLFNFRFPGDSSLGGHSFGNLFLSAVEMMTDNFSEAVKMASKILNIRGTVIPITTKKCQLIMKFSGREVIGEEEIDETKLPAGTKPSFYLKPKAAITEEAKAALKEADLIVIAPGSLYTSIISALVVEGVSRALKAAKAPAVYICNLVNKPNNTAGFTVNDYVSEINKYLKPKIIDYVIYNRHIPKDVMRTYANQEEHPVLKGDEDLKNLNYKIIEGNFLSIPALNQTDLTKSRGQSLLRHDGRAVSLTIKNILSNNT